MAESTATTLNIDGIEDILAPANEKYADALQAAGEAFTEGYNIFNDADFSSRKGWRQELTRPDFSIHSKTIAPYGKVYALRANLPVSVEKAFELAVVKGDEIANWHSHIQVSKIIAKPTEHFDVFNYAIDKHSLIQSRDFVIGRVWRKIDGVYYVVARSAKVDEVKPQRGHVRGHAKILAARLRPHATDANVTHADYLFAADFKGLVPKPIINLVLAKILAKEFEGTEKHYREIANA